MNGIQDMAFCGEIVLQVKIARRAAERLEATKDNFDHIEVWCSIQSILVATGNVSKILCPSEKKYKPRGERLRQMLKVKDDNVFNKERATATRKFIAKYKEASFSPTERDIVYNELESFLLGKSANDISDKNQLSECIASNIDCFITTDKNILNSANKIHKLYSIKVLTPSEFILHIDQLKNKDNYKSVRLAGANYETKNIGSSDIHKLASLFVSNELNEKNMS